MTILNLPISIWDTVCKKIPTSEHEELKQLLGNSLVESTLDIRNEVNNFNNILLNHLIMIETFIM